MLATRLRCRSQIGTASICEFRQAGGPRRPALDLQLKATTDFTGSQGLLRFRLTIKNYRDLRDETQTSRLLVVLELPKDETQWMTVTSDELVLRRRAYWLSLQRDHEEVVGQKAVTVRIPERNVLDVEALKDLVERFQSGRNLMRVSIHDRDALLAVSPPALSAYACSAGWRQHEQYRVHSDIYIGEELPEIIVPRTERLGDYASVVASLIEMFAKVAEQDELTMYRSLVAADRDVVRVRVGESTGASVTLNQGVDLIGGVRDMLLAAACSLGKPKPVYRAGANRDAADLLKGVRLGQTDQGSFVVTLLTPVVPPPMPTLFPDPGDQNAPIARRLTLRLMEALTAARQAVARTTAGDAGAFAEALESGVSANLCEALVQVIEPFPTLDVNVLWARTRPVAAPRPVVRFGRADAPLLREAARLLREQTPRPDVRLCGHVQLLTRKEAEGDGTIRLTTSSIDGQRRSVKAVLERQDYERAVQAHKEQVPVVLAGDLERMGQRWRLLSPQLEEIIRVGV